MTSVAVDHTVHRRPNATRAARRQRELVASYVHALGGCGRVSAMQMLEIERVAGLGLLASEMRAKALRGEAVEITDLTRLEGTLDRAVRKLNLPAPGGAVPVMTLEDHVAANYATGDASEDEGA
jgi:hypothetical protein